MNCSVWRASGIALAVFFVPDGNLIADEIGLDPQQVGEVDAVDVTSPEIAPNETNQSIYWAHSVTKLGSRYMRFRFTVNSEPIVGDATLRVSTFSEPNAYSRRIESGLRGESFWTPLINAQRAEITVVGIEAPVGLEIELDRIAYTTQPGKLSSIIGLDQRQQIWTALEDPLVAKLQSSIAKLSFVAGNRLFVCTGFMLDESYMITNEHCVNSQVVCDSTTAIFGYQESPDGSTNRGTAYPCLSFVRSDFNLDYAILEIARKPGATWGIVPLSRSGVTADEPLFIIQHPAGETKQISLQDCAVSQAVADGRASGTDFAHTCDTLGGSSGSPVFTRDGRLVGLHHYGRGGGFWNENRAVRAAEILSAEQQ